MDRSAPPIVILIVFKLWLRRYLPQWRFYQPGASGTFKRSSVTKSYCADDSESLQCRAHKSDECVTVKAGSDAYLTSLQA
jgi:hypothetical protein